MTAGARSCKGRSGPVCLGAVGHGAATNLLPRDLLAPNGRGRNPKPKSMPVIRRTGIGRKTNGREEVTQRFSSHREVVP